MKRKIVNIALLISCVLIVGCAMGWKKFVSLEGKFTISMPAGKPESYKIIVDTEFGPTYLILFMLDNKDGFIYSVSFIDHYPEFFQRKSRESILDDTRNGAISNVQGKLLSELPTSIKDFPGRYFTFESSNGKMIFKAKIFLVDRRLYDIMVGAPKEKQSSYNLKRFLDSFHLVQGR
jgi:hypothetical protein